MACYIKIKHNKVLHTYSRSNRVKKNLGTLKNTDGKNRSNTRQRKYQTKRPMSVKNNYYINQKEKKPCKYLSLSARPLLNKLHPV